MVERIARRFAVRCGVDGRVVGAVGGDLEFIFGDVVAVLNFS
jgi:hypothetical protein